MIIVETTIRRDPPNIGGTPVSVDFHDNQATEVTIRVEYKKEITRTALEDAAEDIGEKAANIFNQERMDVIANRTGI